MNKFAKFSLYGALFVVLDMILGLTLQQFDMYLSTWTLTGIILLGAWICTYYGPELP